MNNLQLFQGNAQDNETMLVVGDIQIQDPEISSLTFKSKTEIGVETVVPSRFFQNTEAMTIVSGDIKVDFARRRLVVTGYGVRPVSKRQDSPRTLCGAALNYESTYSNPNMRPSTSHMSQPTEDPAEQSAASSSNVKILGRGIARPGYHGGDIFPVEQLAQVDTSQVSKRTSSFQIAVGLTTEVHQAELDDVLPIEMNSSAITWVGASRLLGASAIICFVLASLW